MSTQNQAECQQAALKQASARERTSVTVCRSFSSTTESFLLLLLLLPHQTVSEMQGKQVGSLTLGTLTLSALTQPPPHPANKKFRTFIGILAHSPHWRLRAFVGMVWSTGNKDQLRVGNKCGQYGYLRPIGCDPKVLSSSLGAHPSEPLHFLRVRSAGLETKRSVAHSKTTGHSPLISGRRSPICGPFDQAPNIYRWTREQHPEELLLIPFQGD